MKQLEVTYYLIAASAFLGVILGKLIEAFEIKYLTEDTLTPWFYFFFFVATLGIIVFLLHKVPKK